MSKAQLYFILALFFALAVALFAIQNPESISINFLVWEYNEISKVIVILASTAVGALVVLFLGFWWQLKKLMHIRQIESELKDLKIRLAEKSVAGEKSPGEPPACPSGVPPAGLDKSAEAPGLAGSTEQRQPPGRAESKLNK